MTQKRGKNAMVEMRRFYEEAQGLQEELVACRRALHQMPELGMELPRTTEFVCGELEALGLDRSSQVLLFSTEGDTDPERYRRILWDGELPVV